MKTLFRAMLTILASLGLVFGAMAAPANAYHVTITFDADGTTNLPLAEAAADWSKNTNVRAVVGDCTGVNCVHFKIVEHIPCNWGSAVGGCAYRLSDGSCQVEVATYVLGGRYLDDLVVKHEAGHCIFSFAGLSTAYHLSDSRALMYPTHSGAPSKAEASLSNVDRTFTRSLYS